MRGILKFGVLAAALQACTTQNAGEPALPQAAYPRIELTTVGKPLALRLELDSGGLTGIRRCNSANGMPPAAHRTLSTTELKSGRALFSSDDITVYEAVGGVSDEDYSTVFASVDGSVGTAGAGTNSATPELDAAPMSTSGQTPDLPSLPASSLSPGLCTPINETRLPGDYLVVDLADVRAGVHGATKYFFFPPDVSDAPSLEMLNYLRGIELPIPPE